MFLSGGKPLRFRTYLKTAGSRSDLVARFLAVLELCKSKQITVHGDGENFSIRSRRDKEALPDAQ